MIAPEILLRLAQWNWTDRMISFLTPENVQVPEANTKAATVVLNN